MSWEKCNSQDILWICLSPLNKKQRYNDFKFKTFIQQVRVKKNKDRCYKHISLSLRKDTQFTYSTKPPMYQMTVEVLTPKPAFQLSKTIDKVPVI